MQREAASILNAAPGWVAWLRAASDAVSEVFVAGLAHGHSSLNDDECEGDDAFM